MTVRRAAGVLALPLLLAAAGCGGGGTLSGKVTYDGQPMPGGTVAFTPAQGGQGTGSGATAVIIPPHGNFSSIIVAVG
jgi:hypothetical protein